MRFLKNLKIGNFFGASVKELSGFVCGIGKSKILENDILIEGYPFEPSSVFPKRLVSHQKIAEVHLDNYPPTMQIGNELVFIERTKIEQLEDFAIRHNVKLVKRNSNWDWITEPFLDTEFTPEQQAKTIELLVKNGFTETEILDLREEIREQMFKYNFDTMLWEWNCLGLSDVLSAMRVKYDRPAFEVFYWKAMEIEMRGEIPPQTT